MHNILSMTEACKHSCCCELYSVTWHVISMSDLHAVITDI